MQHDKILPIGFYQQDDVIAISKQLLGKYLYTCFDNDLTGGKIVETEAYRGPLDRASHAYGNRKTTRNATMYEAGGVCYIYLCYGLHVLFNIVTNLNDIPHAILIRGLEPTVGIDIMLKRRHKMKVERSLTGGPGSLSQALGLTLNHKGLSLLGPQIWVQDEGAKLSENDILASPRVGIDYAGEDAQLPWRFRIKNSPWTSLPK
jgi:DNA-3-methyladenine glycosylase